MAAVIIINNNSNNIGTRHRQRDSSSQLTIFIIVAVVILFYFIFFPLSTTTIKNPAFENSRISNQSMSSRGYLRGSSLSTFSKGLFSTLSVSDLSRLIIVPCHGIWIGNGKRFNESDKSGYSNPSSWVVDPWLKDKLADLTKHTSMAVKLASDDPKSLVLFSGGQTRSAAGMRSEGLSYLELATSQEDIRTDVLPRLSFEEFAKDSQENVLFSLCRFKQITGRYPLIVDIVGFGYKKDRFVNEHRKSVRFPSHRFGYISPDSQDQKSSFSDMEHQVTIPQFQRDPFGCKSPLIDKKNGRNPFNQKHNYLESCPELEQLLNYCNNDSKNAANKKLPWE